MNGDSNSLKQRNNSIDLFRVICAVMVVIIHSTFYLEWGKIGVFIGVFFPRIAVPFFFSVSGYFYIKSLENGIKVFRKHLTHILMVYGLWSVIYLSLDFLNIVVADKGSLLLFIRNSLYSFAVTGTREHFWFFPALVVSLCLVTIIHKFHMMKALIPLSLVLYFVGCLGCSYDALFAGVPLFGDMFSWEGFTVIRRIFLIGFPFFSSGYLLIQTENFVKKNQRCLPFAYFASLSFFLIEMYIVVKFELGTSAVITLSLYILLFVTMHILLNNPLPKHEESAKASRIIANFTYYSHPMFQQFFVLGMKVTKINIPNIIVFFMVLILTFSMGYLFYRIQKKTKNKLISLIAG